MLRKYLCYTTVMLVSLSSPFLVGAELSGDYIHEAVCRDEHCYTTQLMPFTDDYSFFLHDRRIDEIQNFSVYLNTQIESLYKDYIYDLAYYDGEDDEDYMITIEWYKPATSTSSVYSTKKVYFQDLIALPSFDVKTGSNVVRYENGRDYFFTHLTDIVDTLHDSIGLPVGKKRNKLTDIHEAILSYKKQTATSPKRTFQMKNVCTDATCKRSDIAYISDSGSSVFILLGEKKEKSEFLKSILDIRSETFALSSDRIQAGERVWFGVDFTDHLTDFSQPYQYTILYQYEWETEKQVLLEEEFSVKKRILRPATSTSPARVEYRIYKPGETQWKKTCTIDPYEKTQAYEDIVDASCFAFATTLPITVRVEDPELQKVRIHIQEGFTGITKIGNVKFYMTLRKRLADGNIQSILENKALNTIPVTVVHGKYIGGLKYSSAEEFLEKTGFINKNTQIEIKDFRFLDKFGNDFTNVLDQKFSIWRSARTSSNIKLIPFGRTRPTDFINNISDLNHLKFSFVVTEYGAFDFMGFQITNNDLAWDPEASFSFIPEDFWKVWEINGWSRLDTMKLYAAPMTTEEVGVVCGQEVKITPVCDFDSLSWCHVAYHSDRDGKLLSLWTQVQRLVWAWPWGTDLFERTYTDPRDNNPNIERYVTIPDVSGNKITRAYTMNHIDQEGPLIDITGDLADATWAGLSLYATDSMYLKIKEQTTTHCELQDAATTVEVKINGVVDPSYSKTYTGNIKEKDADGNNGIDIAFPLTFLKIAGDYDVEITATDIYGNQSEHVRLKFHVEPDPDPKEVKVIPTPVATLPPSPPWAIWPGGKLYADGQNCQMYEYSLQDKFGNVFKNIPLQEVVQACSGGNPTCKTIFADAVTQSGPKALEFFGVSSKTNTNGKLSFCMGSITPGIATPEFIVTLPKWDKSGNLLSEMQKYALPKWALPNREFYKPYIGVLQVSDKTGRYDGVQPKVGTSMKYRLTLKHAASSPGPVDRFSPTLEDYSDFIWAISAGMQVGPIKDMTGLSGRMSYFSTRVGTSSKTATHSELKTNTPWVHIQSDGKSPIIVSYPVNGRESKYYISALDAPEDRTVIKLDSNETFIGVRIIGNLQWQWEQDFTIDKENIGLVTLSAQRSTIRKNAEQFTKGMKKSATGTVQNRVKYIYGQDFQLPDTTKDAGKYDTLVVKDGNVIIGDNIGTSDKPIGIIVLRDNYDVNRDYKTRAGWWNILITPEVSEIHAVMYADGALLSAGTDGKVFERDSSERTETLFRQLRITGTLFTRNTIGWAELWWQHAGYYLLPGNKKVAPGDAEAELAVIYDLNYTRRGNEWCPKDTTGKCIFEEPLIITHNPRIITNPLPLFGK